MKTIIYKKNITAMICLGIIFFSISVLVSAIASFNLFSPFIYSILKNAALLPLILMSAIVEGLYKSIDNQHKLLKFIVIALFIIFALIGAYINQRVLTFATL
ncbi:hypothetical protein [uncultured Clostridium sp.]|jgi:uncharacterized membrane protein|uniref:hypothetical protein n=1 Tax=uncultured Clostridium sp. TaxID=59620 RepID=UPI002636440F|nr:hypothetical protein [uncultured Clostridium sp.]